MMSIFGESFLHGRPFHPCVQLVSIVSFRYLSMVSRDALCVLCGRLNSLGKAHFAIVLWDVSHHSAFKHLPQISRLKGLGLNLLGAFFRKPQLCITSFGMNKNTTSRLQRIQARFLDKKKKRNPLPSVFSPVFGHFPHRHHVPNLASVLTLW
ncbi:hypothetical protein CROQUDRAFT_363616 [Cronartium quercuum f. sp. fusiforme G11]|uniref:Uncharacterized protein n=1 Tax=Cronartium quercuum f. sp. fusiforme G11 TaxID=708437 RepID=A0A9P6NT81_9BASI|nr:hypothetical protein CROQUDRAFT_363616 [Cronartium quercuum f. sp. fusiforme G11]